MGRHTKDAVEEGRAEGIAAASAPEESAGAAAGASPDGQPLRGGGAATAAAAAAGRTAHPGDAHGHRWLVLAVIGVAQLMVVLDATIVNIALPSAQSDLGLFALGLLLTVVLYRKGPPHPRPTEGADAGPIHR